MARLLLLSIAALQSGAATARAIPRQRCTVYRLQPDAAASLASRAARAHLRVVGDTRPRGESTRETPPAAVPPAAATPPSTERMLLDAWREAHWSLRVRLRDVLLREDRDDIEAAYDAARRADNRLTEFYQARADHLARRLRASLVTAGTGTPDAGAEADPVDGQESTLLRHFRGLSEEDRASLVRLAARLSAPSRTL